MEDAFLPAAVRWAAGLLGFAVAAGCACCCAGWCLLGRAPSGGGSLALLLLLAVPAAVSLLLWTTAVEGGAVSPRGLRRRASWLGQCRRQHAALPRQQAPAACPAWIWLEVVGGWTWAFPLGNSASEGGTLTTPVVGSRHWVQQQWHYGCVFDLLGYFLAWPVRLAPSIAGHFIGGCHDPGDMDQLQAKLLPRTGNKGLCTGRPLRMVLLLGLPSSSAGTLLTASRDAATGSVKPRWMRW